MVVFHCKYKPTVFYAYSILMSVYTDSTALHRKHQWKIQICSDFPLETKEDLSLAYSPGVAQPCLDIAADPEQAYELTWKWRTVAVVSDGSAVLGLWNIWGLASLPVMEWKCVLMKSFANVDAVPVVLNTQDPQEIIRIVKAIAPTYGAINLEDIKAPECFLIEETLKKEAWIPIFHDDQHGTAIVVLAGLINAAKLRWTTLESMVVTIAWAWAAGIAIAKLLHTQWVQDIRMTDSRWVLVVGREWMNPYKDQVAEYNTTSISGTLQDALRGSDVFVGVSQPWIITTDDVREMNDKPIIFALSNPEPEILIQDAKDGWAFIYASWRSDLPNQVNNVLAFPGIFRGVLDARIPQITDAHKVAAAHALAEYVTDLWVENILPNPLDKKVSGVVAEAVKSV